MPFTTAEQPSARGTLSAGPALQTFVSTSYLNVLPPAVPGLAPAASSTVAMLTPVALHTSSQQPTPMSPPRPPIMYTVLSVAAYAKRTYGVGMAARLVYVS